MCGQFLVDVLSGSSGQQCWAEQQRAWGISASSAVGSETMVSTGMTTEQRLMTTEACLWASYPYGVAAIHAAPLGARAVREVVPAVKAGDVYTLESDLPRVSGWLVLRGLGSAHPCAGPLVVVEGSGGHRRSLKGERT